MNRTLQPPGGGETIERPIEELSALRDVDPPAALVARVMTRLAEPRPPSLWHWLRRPFPIEIRLSPFAIICLALALGAVFVLVGANIR
jgi:hypothetical protein